MSRRSQARPSSAAIGRSLSKLSKTDLLARVAFLQRIFLFQGWPEDELKRLAYALSYRKYEKHQTVIKQGDTTDVLYFMMSGRARVVQQVSAPAPDQDGRWADPLMAYRRPGPPARPENPHSGWMKSLDHLIFHVFKSFENKSMFMCFFAPQIKGSADVRGTHARVLARFVVIKQILKFLCCCGVQS